LKLLENNIDSTSVCPVGWCRLTILHAPDWSMRMDRAGWGTLATPPPGKDSSGLTNTQECTRTHTHIHRLGVIS
jgi:hypothetical protein